MPQRSHNANRRFKTRLQTVERIIGGGDERVNHFVVFEQSHDRAVADGAHEIFFHIFGSVKVDNFAGFQPYRHTSVGMFAISGYADDRFGLERYLQSVQAERFLDQNPGKQFVIDGLNRRSETPVDFHLLHDVVEIAGFTDFGFYAADFFVAHFRLQSVSFKHQHSVFQCSTGLATGALPVILLHDLCC